MIRNLPQSKSVYRHNENPSNFRRATLHSITKESQRFRNLLLKSIIFCAALPWVTADFTQAATPQAITGVKEWLRQELLNAEKIYPIESGSTEIRLHQAQSLTDKFNPYQVVLEISKPKENQQEFYKIAMPFKMINTVSVRDGSILVFGRIQSENDFQMSDRILKIRYRDPDNNKLVSSITSQDVTDQGVKVGPNENKD